MSGCALPQCESRGWCASSQHGRWSTASQIPPVATSWKWPLHRRAQSQQISRRGYKSKAYLIPKGVRQEKARGNLYSCSQCASLIWRATTASLPWKRHNLQRQDLLLLLDPNPLAATISMFWLIKAPPARSRGKMSFRCQCSYFICICHTSHCARYFDIHQFISPSFLGHACTIALFRATRIWGSAWDLYHSRNTYSSTPLITALVAQGRTICLLSFGSGPMTRLLISDLQISRSDPQWDLIPRPPHS